MTASIKANVDGSAAIQVGGTDVITLTSGGAATFVTSPTTVQAGTAAAPSITTSGDTNTGIFFPAADTIAFTEGGVESMRIDSAGNVGIGTSSPTGRLTVVGSGSVTQFISSSNGGTIRLGFDSTGSIYNWIESDSTVGMRFATSNTERARIDSSGNLLVGKTAADDSSPGVWLYNNSAQAGRINIAKNTTGLFNALANYHSGTYVGGVNYSNTATAFPTSSDVRLKKDIVDAGSASAKIEQIRIVSHGWKHDDEVVEFGVVAQELVNVAPQAVSAGDDGEEIETTWGVDYSKLVPMLIKAHQEQQAMIDEMKAEIAALKAQP